MMKRKINRLIIKKDGKVYSFRCSASGGAVHLSDADFVYIAFVADLLYNSEIVIHNYTSLGRSNNVVLNNVEFTKNSRCQLQIYGYNPAKFIRSLYLYNDLEALEKLDV